MKEFGVEEKFLFADIGSGKDFDRPAYRSLLRRLTAGDTLVVKSLDRLGRNYDEVLNEWKIITKEKGAFIVILDLPLLDTREKKIGDVTGVLISDIVLELFSYVAQVEREMNHQRTMEGITAAKSKGVHCGRPALILPEEFKNVFTLWKSGKISERKAAKKLGVSRPTFHKWTLI